MKLVSVLNCPSCLPGNLICHVVNYVHLAFARTPEEADAGLENHFQEKLINTNTLDLNIQQ